MYSSTCFWLCITWPGSYFRCLCVDKASLWNIPQELSLDGVSTLQYVSFVSPFVRLERSSVLFVDLLLFSVHQWVSACVRLPVCESVFCGCVCSCFFSTEMSDSLLVRNCLCASRQHVRVCMCMSVVNYGGRRGVDRLSPLECICIWNSKVRTNVFLSGRVPEGSREISLSYFTCQTLKRDRWELVRDACEPVGLLRSQLPIHNHRHRIPQRKGMVGRAEVRYKTAFWMQTQTDL